MPTRERDLTVRAVYGHPATHVVGCTQSGHCAYSCTGFAVRGAALATRVYVAEGDQIGPGIVLVNVARSPQDTIPTGFANNTETTDTQNDNDQEGKAENDPATTLPYPRTPDDQC